MQALAERSPDRNEHRMDEPYRRALTGMYARLAATLHELTGTEAAAPRGRAARPLSPTPEELLADLRVIEASLRSHHAQALIAPRLTPLMRAIQVFGFHLATVDLRQSSDQHETAVMAELLATARICADYSALDEAGRRALLLQLLQRRAPPARDRRGLQRAQSLGELAIFEAAREALQRFGRDAIRHYIISHTESVSDLLEVMLLLKEAGLLRGTLDEHVSPPPAGTQSAPRGGQAVLGSGPANGLGAINDLIVSPLFETIGDLREAPATSCASSTPCRASPT